jgi:hypothetical protein
MKFSKNFHLKNHYCKNIQSKKHLSNWVETNIYIIKITMDKEIS